MIRASLGVAQSTRKRPHLADELSRAHGGLSWESEVSEGGRPPGVLPPTPAGSERTCPNPTPDSHRSAIGSLCVVLADRCNSPARGDRLSATFPQLPSVLDAAALFRRQPLTTYDLPH